MSETRAIYGAEMVLRAKLAQFGAITRHLLCTENLSDEGLRALMLLTEKCEPRNISECIQDAEFEKFGLADQLADWEKAGFASAREYSKVHGKQTPEKNDWAVFDDTRKSQLPTK
jgi:hypothetical protein